MCYNTFNVPVRTIDANGIVTEYKYNDAGLVASAVLKDGAETIASVTVAYDKNRHTNTFTWDGLALIQRGDEHFLNEPHVGGGNPVVSSKGTSYFNDMLGTTVGAKPGKQYSAAALSAFGERLDNGDSTSPAIRSLGEGWFTGKPAVAGLGHAFLMRNYRAGLAKWQTADPMGYPENAPKKLRFGGKPRAQRSARRARKGPRWNALAYCNNGAVSCVDVAGGWCAEVHHDINETYLTNQGISLHEYNWGGIALDVLGELNAGSDWTDSVWVGGWLGNQNDDKAYMHAMSSSWEGTAGASFRWNSYLNQVQLQARAYSDSARTLYNAGLYDSALEMENLAVEYLGRLFHTYDDSFAPAHAGFQWFSEQDKLWHMSLDQFDVYVSGVYVWYANPENLDYPYGDPGRRETVHHAGGYRNYIYQELFKRYAETVWYVLRQPEWSAL